jgi:ubiquinone/menaquinone biosynthesis C-methylase UbiE
MATYPRHQSSSGAEELVKQMRRDWDMRAKEDARFYVACGRRNESEAEFLQHAADVVARIRRDMSWLPPGSPEASWRFLEIGCGIGRLLSYLAHDCGEIHGVDISEEMLAQGRARLANLTNVHLHHTPHSDLRDFPDDSFDLVFSYAVFQHLPSVEFVWRYLEEAARVLRPGGVLTAQVNTLPIERDHYDCWSGVLVRPDQLIAHCRAGGLCLRTLEGTDAQYTWITAQKVPSIFRGLSRPSVIRAILSSDGALDCLAARDIVKLRVAFLPSEACEVAELEIRFRNLTLPVSRIGVADAIRERELEARLPAAIDPGPAKVALYWRGTMVSDFHEVVVSEPIARKPCIVRATDGQELSRHNVSSCGWVKLWLRNWFHDKAIFAVELDGTALSFDLHCDDRFLGAWQVNVELPKDLKSGDCVLSVTLEPHPASPVTVPIQVISAA